MGARGSDGGASIDEVLPAVEALAAVGTLAELRASCVQAVSRLVPCTLAAWNEVDLRTGSIEAVLSIPWAELGPDHFVDRLRRSFVENVAEHPVIGYVERTGDGRPYAISDFLSAEAFHSTLLYQHFYRHLGAEDQLSFVLPDPGLVIGVALNRDRRGFSARDRAVCNLLRPYLVHLYASLALSSQIEGLIRAFDEATDVAGRALVLLGPNLSRPVLHATPAARALLGLHFDGFRGDTLPEEVSRWLAGQSSGSPPAAPLVCRRGGRMITIQHVQTSSGAVLVLSEPATGAIAPAAARLGLTAREAEVIALVCTGMPTKHIAARLQLSPRTVDKHVQSCLDKLGVRSRMAAAAVLSNRGSPV